MEKEITVEESPLLTAVSPKPQAHQQNAAKTQKKKFTSYLFGRTRRQVWGDHGGWKLQGKMPEMSEPERRSPEAVCSLSLRLWLICEQVMCRADVTPPS